MSIFFKLNILKHYLNTKYNLLTLNKNNLEKFQNKMIKKQLKYVLKRSDYFRKKVDNNNYNLYDFPIIDKSIMMDNFDDFCTININKEEAFDIAINSEKSRNFKPELSGYSIGLSSGTSGNRGIFVASDEDKALWTGRILAKLLPKSLLSKERIAFFLRANNNVYESLNSSKIKFLYFDLLDKVETNIEKLQSFNPTIISAPPSMLVMIAKAMEQGKLKINPIRVFSVAEVLYDSDKEYLKKIFNQTIHQIYQCTEGFLAHTCKEGIIHINEDMVKIDKEYLDEELGRFVPIITDFRRKTQPILRYRLNDILLEKKEKCTCGSDFMAIERIEGREDDIFYFMGKDNKKVSVFPDFFSRAIIYSSDKIEDYYICQRKIDDINIYMKLKDDNKEIDKIKKEIIKNMDILKEKLDIKNMEISFTGKYFLGKDRKKKRVERIY